jgi:hypothetical protein
MAWPSTRTGWKAWMPRRCRGRSAVQKNRVLADDLFDDIEDDAVVAIDDLIGLLMGGHIASLDEKSGDERTE